MTGSPFHIGEQAVQERLGVRGVETWARRAVRDHLTEQHRDFHTSLPFLVAAARDADGRPWATLLTGDSGFVTSPDDRTLRIGAAPVPGDALSTALKEGDDLGILGIEFSTRRRNRVNGRVGKAGEAVILRVDQAFGNCPQYVRGRAWWRVSNEDAGAAVRTNELSDSQQGWIRDADTFFIASGYRGAGEDPSYGMDASHRGGDPGFVEVLDSRRLRFPDYAGNNYFNTIGNLALDPRVGVTFVDFESGSLLQVTGRARIDWDSDAVAARHGARRLITIEIGAVVDLPGALPLRWDGDGETVRSLELAKREDESADVTSFVLKARDGHDLPAFEPGQHLPIQLLVAGHEHPIRRTYSLSSRAGADYYRISVKREPRGVFSRLLHDHVAEGAIVEAARPAGDFVLAPGDHPAALIGAGVGVTPLVSMLHELSEPTRQQPVWFVYGARDGAHHPLAGEVAKLAESRHELRTHVAYSRPRPDDTGYDSVGRIDGPLIERLVDRDDAHYYVCGPSGFMATVLADLERRGVPAERVHAESFGPFG